VNLAEVIRDNHRDRGEGGWLVGGACVLEEFLAYVEGPLRAREVPIGQLRAGRGANDFRTRRGYGRSLGEAAAREARHDKWGATVETTGAC